MEQVRSIFQSKDFGSKGPDGSSRGGSGSGSDGPSRQTSLSPGVSNFNGTVRCSSVFSKL